MIGRTPPRGLLALLLFFTIALAPVSAAADQRLIVRTSAGIDGLSAVQAACSLVGCTVQYGLDGPIGQLFLVTTSDTNAALLTYILPWLPGISAAELDAVLRTLASDASSPPPALTDTNTVSYYGATVREGYLTQPAATIVGVSAAHSQFALTGNGVTVAVIDTGVDPSHPVLAPVLTSGYDFTRNQQGGSERGDVSQSTVAVVDGVDPAWVNQSTVAVVDQSTVGVVDDGAHAAFGHGTMVAGVVHLVAPRATIMPLKAFNADGSGYESDVLRAIYYAVRNGAKVLNMSFSFSSSSAELSRAIQYAQANDVVPVAAAGNDGMQELVYPAAYTNVVGVASTTDADTLSTFSNFGPSVAFLAAPGEGVVTTYPFGTWAAAWGTSFSAPFAAGAAALLAELQSTIGPSQAASAEGHAKWISQEVKTGRLDLVQMLQAAGAPAQ